MKKYLLLFSLLSFLFSTAQVTQIWTDYNNYWTSGSGMINAVKPNTAHNLLAFKWNGMTYSTGVNNTKLTDKGVVFNPTKFRALPINSVPLGTGSDNYFIGLGALVDGLPNTVDNGPTNPFKPILSGTEKAKYLTKGIQGLDLGSCLTNIPTGIPIRFNLSTRGITETNVGDAIPDLFITQVADPTTGSAKDKFKFVDAAGAIVGTEFEINFNVATAAPNIGTWNVDFYKNDSSQNPAAASFVNSTRGMRFIALDLSQMGITKDKPEKAGNFRDAVALIYTPSGDSDPAFLAFNEPSLGVATKLAVTAQPTTSNCSGTMSSNFTVQLEDAFGFPVKQAGITITASMETGPGALLGTLTVTTDANGLATFTNLSFEVGGNHQIRFSNSSLDAGISMNIVGATGCADNIWTGNGTNSNWNNTANWQTGVIPNANNNVEIPAGRSRYPVLQSNAGAKNIILGAGASIDLNGQLFTIAGNVTRDVTAKIVAGADNSNLYYSGTSAQTINQGLLSDGKIANLTIENAAGVTNADVLKISQVLLVRTGTFTTADAVTMVCRFTPTRRTAQIGPLSDNSYINGDVTVEQCFPARRAFRLLSSSVNTTGSIRANWQENASAWNDNPKPGYGTHITGTGASGASSTNDGKNGFDWQPSGNPSLFKFDNGTQLWSAATNTTDNLTAGSPYRMLIRGDRSINIQKNSATPTNTILRSKGTIVKGPVTTTNLSTIADGFNFVGNPFQANVDMAKVIGESVNIKSFYTIWDPTLGGTPTPGQPGGRGAYVTINALTGEKSNPSSQMTTLLQPYQAFFVQTLTAAAPPALTFKEEHKAVNGLQTNTFRLSNEEAGSNQFIELSLYTQAAFNTSDTSSDGLRIDFSSSANNEVDQFDAPKFSNLDENIARTVDDTLISMENRELPQSGEVLPLDITQYRSDAYTMAINLSPFKEYEVYLRDRFTNQDIKLENGAATHYRFTVPNGDAAAKAADRFAFYFQTTVLNVVQPGKKGAFSVYPNPVNGAVVYVNGDASFGKSTLEIYNAVGQKVKQVQADFGSSKQTEIPVQGLASGMYIVNMTTAAGETFSTKLIRN